MKIWFVVIKSGQHCVTVSFLQTVVLNKQSSISYSYIVVLIKQSSISRTLLHLIDNKLK